MRVCWPPLRNRPQPRWRWTSCRSIRRSSASGIVGARCRAPPWCSVSSSRPISWHALNSPSAARSAMTRSGSCVPKWFENSQEADARAVVGRSGAESAAGARQTATAGADGAGRSRQPQPPRRAWRRCAGAVADGEPHARSGGVVPGVAGGFSTASSRTATASLSSSWHGHGWRPPTVATSMPFARTWPRMATVCWAGCRQGPSANRYSAAMRRRPVRPTTCSSPLRRALASMPMAVTR